MEKYLKLILISTGISLCTHFSSQAQDFSDFGLLFGQRDLYGSARLLGTGGNHNALGGDLSSAAYNPAGLGFYQQSEFSVSPSINFLNTSTDYLSNSTDDFKSPLNIASGGAVLNRSRRSGETGGWKGGSWGFSISRIGSFQDRINYIGDNTSSDFIDFAVDDFNFGNGGELSTLAVNTGLVGEFFAIFNGEDSISINGIEYLITDLYGNINSGDTLFFADRDIFSIFDSNQLAFPSSESPTTQSEIINRTGAQYQTSISYGGNYADKVYFGASLGLIALNYDSERIYREIPTESTLTNFTLTDERIFSGGGVNGTFGVIVRPVDELSIGISYTTPTYYFLEDESVLSARAQYNNGEELSDQQVFLPVRIDLTTPSRLSGGVAFFIGKYGFITADVEYMDYGNMKFSSDEFSLDFANQEIRDKYQAVYNYNVGGEFRYDIFRLRAGYSNQGNPLTNVNGTGRESFTVGAGLRFKDYFIDGALVHSNYNSSIGPYPDGPTALIDHTSNNAVITIGKKF